MPVRRPVRLRSCMGRVRIIAGELRGRRIEVVEADGLRPTPDRVREALFSILGDRLAGAAVLDAYAGSGALGYEALSRGARHVVFVDVAEAAVRGLERSRAALGCLDRCRVIQGDLPLLMDRGALGGPFDLVLADPPYGTGEHGRFLAAAARHELLGDGGLLVIESEARDQAGKGLDPDGLSHQRRAIYGRSALDFYAPAAHG